MASAKTRLLALRTRALASGVSLDGAWEGVTWEPSQGETHIEEAYVTGTSAMQTFPADGGQAEETGLYVLRFYGPVGKGLELRDMVDDVMAQFTPGTPITIADGSTLRVRADFGPYASEARRLDGGWLAITLTIPWLARSTNTVAA
jgi:hypothetical protein